MEVWVWRRAGLPEPESVTNSPGLELGLRRRLLQFAHEQERMPVRGGESLPLNYQVHDD